jgi:hypothetical protein
MVWVLFWLAVWFVISLATFALLVLSVALDEGEPFIKTLFEDTTLLESNCTVFAILFPVGLLMSLIPIVYHLCKKIKIKFPSFSFRGLLKKIFMKKYIRNRVMEEV